MQTAFGSGHGSKEGQDLALTDPLTGLGNLRRFVDKVDRLIRDRADDPAPFTVGILDLDGFKPINDLFGHHAGDHILVQVAMRLRAAMDGQAAVTRIGADEFGFLFPLVFSEDAASEKARMLIEILSAPYDVGERTARLSASVGCSLYYSGEETTGILLHKAETALYQAASALDRAISTVAYLADQCRTDIDSQCASVSPGQGRIVQCLADHKDVLTPPCTQAISTVRAQIE